MKKRNLLIALLATGLVLASCEDGNFDVNTSSVTYVNYDDSVLYTTVLSSGGKATYEGADPTKPATKDNSYKFTGWSDPVIDIANNKVYKAQFDTMATVTFKNYDSSVLNSTTVKQGETAVYVGDNPTKESKDENLGYVFNGWDKALENVQINFETTAQFKEAIIYTISFLNYDGTTLQEIKVFEGDTPVYSRDTPTKPSETTGTYEFTGWSPEITAATKDKTYIAQYKFVASSGSDSGKEETVTDGIYNSVTYGMHTFDVLPAELTERKLSDSDIKGITSVYDAKNKISTFADCIEYYKSLSYRTLSGVINKNEDNSTSLQLQYYFSYFLDNFTSRKTIGYSFAQVITCFLLSDDFGDNGLLYSLEKGKRAETMDQWIGYYVKIGGRYHVFFSNNYTSYNNAYKDYVNAKFDYYNVSKLDDIWSMYKGYNRGGLFGLFKDVEQCQSQVYITRQSMAIYGTGTLINQDASYLPNIFD